MKKIFVFCIVLCFLACNEEPKIDYAIISGKIVNPVENIATIYKGNERVKIITLNSNGTFVDTVKVDGGYLKLQHGRATSEMFLNPGDNILLSADANAFNKSLEYSGLGSEDSKFLATKFLNEKGFNLNYEKLYAMEEYDFLAIMNEVKSSKIEFLKAATKISEELRQSEEQNIENEFFEDLQNYLANHSKYTKEDNYQPSKDFLNYIESLK